MLTEADESSVGSASFTIEDPDCNPILVDQHIYGVEATSFQHNSELRWKLGSLQN